MRDIEKKIIYREALIDKLKAHQRRDINKVKNLPNNTISNIWVTKEKILSVCLKMTRLEAADVFKKQATGKVNRERHHVELRQMYFYIAKKITGNSLKRIGRVKIKGVVNITYDHSTVIHGNRSWMNIMSTEPKKKKLTEQIISILR